MPVANDHFEIVKSHEKIQRLEAENKRLTDIAGEALGFSEYQRDHDTVEVLANYSKRLAEELDKVKAAKERTVDQVEALTLSLEFANKELAAVKGELAECKAEIHRARTDSRYWDEFNTISAHDATRNENDALRARCERLEGVMKAIESEPMPTGEPEESIWIVRQQVADELKQALEVPK